MNEYQLGKDIQRLEQRIILLEEQLIEDSTGFDREYAPIRFTEETKADEAAGIIASKTWDMPVHRSGKCELRPGGTVTLTSSGAFSVVGTRKCNTGGIKSCKEHEINVAFFRDSSPNPIYEEQVKRGLMGPGSERGFSARGESPILRDLYNAIVDADLWVTYCRTGV